MINLQLNRRKKQVPINAGKALTALLESGDVTAKQLSFDLHVSQSMITHMKKNDRPMQRDIAETSLREYDLPNYAMDLIREFSQGYAPPRINGRKIDFDNRLAVEQIAIEEATQAVNILKDVSLVKPPLESDEHEIERIKQVIREVAEAEWMLANLKALLATTYALPLKKLLNDVFRKWKAEGWLE